MSAPKASRNSPSPEDQSSEQVGTVGSGSIGAASGDNSNAQDQSDDTKENVLESNPAGALDEKAKESTSKEGRGVGI